MNSTSYFHEYKEKITSSNTSSGFILDLSASSRTVVVGRRLDKFNCYMVCMVIMLITDTMLVKVFGIHISLMYTKTMGLPGSTHLSTKICPNIKSTIFPIN